jgi:hypothetical protein
VVELINKRLVYDLASLQPARTVLRQDVGVRARLSWFGEIRLK